MDVLIDGDNLLHAARGDWEAAERANRAWLCRMLARWARRTSRDVTIVFDGVRPANPGDGPVAEDPLVVRYSGSQTADDILVEILESLGTPRCATVVSSDRMIRQAARRCRAKSLDSAAFITSVSNDLERYDRAHPSEPREKYDGLNPKNRDYWLEQFGIANLPED
jgi:predicted RNA-binding protein with PIN domain